MMSGASRKTCMEVEQRHYEEMLQDLRGPAIPRRVRGPNSANCIGVVIRIRLLSIATTKQLDI